MTIAASLRQGTVEAARRWRIAVVLYAANLAAAAVLAVPMAALVTETVARSTAARGFESVFRFDLLLDFLRVRKEALASQFLAIGAGAVSYAVLGALLTGGVIDTLRTPTRSPFLPRFCGGCGRFALRYLRLLPYLAVTLAGIALLNRGLDALILRAFDQAPHEVAAFWCMRGKQGILLAALLIVAAIFDLARILTAVEDRTHMIGALLTSSGFVARHLPRMLALYGLLMLAGLLLYAPYVILTARVMPAASLAGVFVLQQILMAVRHLLRVVWFASALAFYRGATGAAGPETGEETVAPGTASGAGAAPSGAPRLARVLVVLLLAAPVGPGAASAAEPAPLSRRVVDYRIDASLDAVRHRVRGRESVTYHNRTSRPMTDVRLHLYPNAFSNSRTVYMRGAAWDDHVLEAQLERTERERSWGSMTVSSVRLQNGPDLTAAATVDETLMSVPLPAPVPPGGAVDLEIAWETQLPRTIHRTGYWGEHHDVMQWFPKIGVFTDEGWKVYPFYRRSEFFADFGTFEVNLTVPRSYRVEATGIPGVAHDNPDGTRTFAYHAADVHDFAWFADPDLVLDRRVVAQGPYASAPVEVIDAHPPYRGRVAPRILAAAERALLWYGAHVMPYPYPRLVIDDLPMGLGGGMEYPMLFTISSAWFHPRFYTSIEEVTTHEFGHQYWYGIMATNEFEEPWLDEGINSYVTRRLLEETSGAGRPGRTTAALFAYGAGRLLDEGIALPLPGLTLNLDQLVGFRSTPFRLSGGGLLGSRFDVYHLALPGLETGRLEESRQRYAAVARDDPLTTPSWGFHPGSYSAIVYGKTDVVLETMRRLLGGDVLDEALRIYVERYRFTHPGAGELLGVLRETAARRRPGLDLAPVIETLVRGTGTVDFAVESLRSRPLRPTVGFVAPARAGEPPADRLNPPVPGPEEDRFETEVVVRRRGEAILPVDLVTRFADGTERRERWDGQGTWARFVYESKTRADRAEVDPDHLYAIDLDVTNNGRTLEPQLRPAGRLVLTWLFWLQNYLGLAASLS